LSLFLEFDTSQLNYLHNNPSEELISVLASNTSQWVHKSISHRYSSSAVIVFQFFYMDKHFWSCCGPSCSYESMSDTPVECNSVCSLPANWHDLYLNCILFSVFCNIVFDINTDQAFVRYLIDFSINWGAAFWCELCVGLVVKQSHVSTSFWSFNSMTRCKTCYSSFTFTFSVRQLFGQIRV